jgi:A/G-specific adenine glycosylase
MPEALMPVKSRSRVSHKILRWFERHARDLPWRNPPGAPLPLGDPDWPYRVWLSEIMLQQTTVAAVRPYFAAFTARWPSVSALAEADDSEVMRAWAGLGYYARARNLLACARAVVADHGGRLPDEEAALRSLPGIGRYTAAAIAAFAFGKHAVVIDGNIERVAARLFAIETPLPAAKAEIAERVAELTPDERAGDFAQGLMDLAQAICTPRAPNCLLCPVADDCAGKAEAERYPVKAAKPAKPERYGTAWWIEREGRVLLVRRPARGLLGGMLALPGTDWKPFPPQALLGEGDHCTAMVEGYSRPDGDTSPPRRFASRSPSPSGTRGGECVITHVFTHFRLTLTIVRISPEKSCVAKLGGEWWLVGDLPNAGLPSLYAKAVRATIEGGFE